MLSHPNQHSLDGHIKFFVMNIGVVRERSKSSGDVLRLSILVWLTLQNSVHALLVRYSRVRNVEKMFLSSVAVFFTEILKAITCILCIIYEEKGIGSMQNLVKRQVFGNPKDTLKLCVPAMVYIIQNNLFYVAASHLEAAPFMVTSQLKIFTTALFAVIILKKAITRKQWFSLCVLFVGVCLIHLEQNQKTNSYSMGNPFLGIMAVFFACILSGFAGIYFEKILKSTAPISVWMRNVQMSLFAVPSSFIGSLLQDYKTIHEEGFLCGFDALVWIVVFWYCIGGLTVALCIKYVDNIAKNFATSVAIIISTVVSVYLFDFIPNIPFLCGAGMVISSIFLYSSPNVSYKSDYMLPKQFGVK